MRSGVHTPCLAMLLVLAAGCATNRGPRVVVPPPPTEASVPAPPDAATAGAAPAAAPEPAPRDAAPPAEATKPTSPCSEGQTGDAPMVDDARRLLHETLCGASLWFDGLFGEGRDVAAARSVYGRLEMATTYSEAEGTKVRVRLRLRAQFPNLENRLEAFLGREDDEEDVIRGREEGLGLSSQFLNVETREHWLGGLGYSLPGNYKTKRDFRLGLKGGSEPEIFAQGRLRRNVLLGARDALRFRETLFWTNRDGFGSTSSFDYDHLVSRTLLFRWGSVGTVSEATEGLDWRSALVLYNNLRGRRAIAYEAFVRGETEEVELKEYGARTIYRQSLLGRPWLYGELVAGYSWPQLEVDVEREGSALIGFGIELHYGRDY